MSTSESMELTEGGERVITNIKPVVQGAPGVTAVKKEYANIKLVKSDPEVGLGFNIKGGWDQPYLVGDNGIFVTKIREEGLARIDGRLNVGDRIIKLNGKDMTNMSHVHAVNLFRVAGPDIDMLVEKKALKTAGRKDDLFISAQVHDNLESDAKSSWPWMRNLIGGSLLTGGLALSLFLIYKYNGFRFPLSKSSCSSSAVCVIKDTVESLSDIPSGAIIYSSYKPNISTPGH